MLDLHQEPYPNDLQALNYLMAGGADYDVAVHQITVAHRRNEALERLQTEYVRIASAHARHLLKLAVGRKAYFEEQEREIADRELAAMVGDDDPQPSDWVHPSERMPFYE